MLKDDKLQSRCKVGLLAVLGSIGREERVAVDPGSQNPRPSGSKGRIIDQHNDLLGEARLTGFGQKPAEFVETPAGPCEELE